MTIHLYGKSKTEAFRLCQRVIHQLGFSIQGTDPLLGNLSGLKPASNSDFLFIDLKLTISRYSVRILIVSGLFAGSYGTFSSNNESEALFMETLYSMLYTDLKEHILPFQGKIQTLTAA